ncbi:MAG: hypothetical protein AAFY98_12570, partial [Verrucomicrobiota bacterium]
CTSVFGYRLQVIESFLLKVAAISPSSMDRICRIILNINHTTGGLSRDRLVSRFLALAERHFENGAMFEVIWLLYAVRGLKKPFSSPKISELSEDFPSGAVRLLLMDMKAKGICLNKLPIGKWEIEASEDRALSDWSWLYTYEAIRKGWMSDVHGLLTHPFFKAMDDRNIVFYDPTKNIRSSRAVKAEQFEIRKKQNLQAVEFLNALRGVHGSDDFDWHEY